MNDIIEIDEKYKWLGDLTVNELFCIVPHSVCTKENEPYNNFYFNLNISYIVERTEPTIQIKRIYSVKYKCDTCPATGLFFVYLFDHPLYDESLSVVLVKTIILLIENGLMENKKITIENTDDNQYDVL